MELSTLPLIVWSIFLVVLFFGGSIFVHELGHFLAARWRGLRVERFSIGFGPKIVSWRGKDGVEYRISWLPLGGYVALPQLADMRAIEGESSADAEQLPPPSYRTKVIVFVAGALFNVIFAFGLATVLWFIGQKIVKEDQTNRVGVVLSQIELPNGEMKPGPAFAAGVKPGDVIRSVDGKSVKSLSEIGYLVALGSGRGPNYEPKVDLAVERDGQVLPITVFPLRVGSEKMRDIGLEATTRVFIERVQKTNAVPGLKADDLLTHIDDRPIDHLGFIRTYLRQIGGRPVKIAYVRDGVPASLVATPIKAVDEETKLEVYRLGIALRPDFTIEKVHINPWEQVSQKALSTWRSINSLISPHSDVGLSNVSGPIGIAERLYSFAKAGFAAVLWFTILINVNLAIFNLLPIPVLDGGHILFATIAKLRGRALPADLIATAQSIFIVLLFSTIIYVSVFDVRRISRENRAESAAAKAEKADKAAAAAPTAAPATP